MSSTPLKDLFNASKLLVDSQGNSSSFPDLSPGGVLGLYFTAQCFSDEFTPTLVDFWRRVKQREQFEIIAISLEDDQKAFDEHRAALPWSSVSTHGDRGTRLLDALRRRYLYRRLPSLILIDATSGELITDIGRQCVLNDSNGDNFPWRPLALSSILAATSGSKLMNGSKDTVDNQQALEGKLKALYFSSHDCAPCQDFTPLLVDSYVRIKSAGFQFEVVFVSGDDLESEFSANYAQMPWLALPFGDIRIAQLESHFQIYGYPQVILLNENNELITTEGCSVIMSDPKGWKFPWPIQFVEELNDDTEIALRFRPCLTLLTGCREDLMCQALHLLADISEEYHGLVKASQSSDSPLPDLHFFYEGPTSSDAVETLSSNLQLKAQRLSKTVLLQPRVILVDFKRNRYFVCWSDENSAADAISDEPLRHLVDKYKEGTLAYKQIPDPQFVDES